MALSPETFERLMNWLHPNREEAGEEYQRIRTLLVRKFQALGYHSPDDLADATMDRGGEKLTPERICNWVGAKERYFYRVGYYILQEAKEKDLREPQMPDGLDATEPEKEDVETESQCLERCMHKLTAMDSDLIRKYYRGEKAIKKKNRVQLALDLNIDLPSLRVRALRIRAQLRKCINKCLQEAEA